ncbi:tryptophan 2,3-dioxygenase [Qipengyuania sp. ASV99]|uniref:tryptophan 2,3-dioxygenase n=1 Tax=Qipengyuania sp. ASV99 TaxID=3399681 RepID=UPI003A4C52E1
MKDHTETENPPIRRFVERGVETFEATIEGEIIRWDRGLTYSSHLQTAQLLSSQTPVSDKPDEMLFIIMHQTMELWIKLMLHEVREAMDALRADRLDQAGRTLDRTATIMQHMIHSWEVLATLSPPEFLSFRGFLSKASGFQSQQYRELEFLLGLKRADLILVHAGDDAATASLTKVLNTPSLYDEVLKVLARHGAAIPAHKLERDWAQPYTQSEEVEHAWRDIYANPEAHWPLYALGEKVTALEYYFQEWRFKHMKTVARVIGYKHGTGGSSGVAYLVRALDLQFFPELWSMRTRMKVKDDSGAHAQGSGSQAEPEA